MKLRIGLFALIVLIGVTVATIINMNYYSDDPKSPNNRSPENRLVVINPEDVNGALVDPELKDVSKGHTISDFSFVNQLADTITQKDLEGQIYVTNYFFTTCGGICPKMSRQLQRLQKEFRNDEHLKILSHTVRPSYDSVPVMYNYAEKFEADHEKWWFLTGEKKALYLMARRSYLVVPDEKDPNFEHGDESDFIHTENFVLVDPDKRIRGMYDGTNPDEISKLMLDIYDLKKEYGFKSD